MPRQKSYLPFMIGLSVEKAGSKHRIGIFLLIPLFPLWEIKMREPEPENPGIDKVNFWHSLSSLPEVLKRNSYSNRVLLLGSRIVREKRHSPTICPWGVDLHRHMDILIKSSMRDLSHSQVPGSFICLTQQRKFTRWILYIGYFCYRIAERSKIWTSWGDFAKVYR